MSSQQNLESPKYEYHSSLKRPHGSKKNSIYSIDFFPTSSSSVFAACGGRKVTIFEIQDSSLQVLRGFLDEDEKEDYYCSAWTVNDQKSPLLCVGGESGVIKLLDIETCSLSSILVGHGGPIYDLLVHSKFPGLIFSCGKDESIRLWSISARHCIIVFAGDQGHRDAVLSLDVHFSGKWLVSSGMDNTIKIWELDVPVIENAVNKTENSEKFRASFIQFPAFTTRRVHTDYVDCVRFVGDLLLSKSIENKCTLWKPDTRRRNNSVALLRTYPYNSGELWYVRFGLNSNFSVLCIGGTNGSIFLFNVDGGGQFYQEIKHDAMKGIVRTSKFSPNDQYLVTSCDDETIWCFKLDN